MENTNSDSINSDIVKLCDKYQRERIGGQWYISQTGLNKVAKLLGGTYYALTPNQSKQFRSDCVNCAMDRTDMKSWWYYINI